MKSKNTYTREELMNICENAVVHHTKWSDRDSYSAQVMIASVYEGLSAGFDFVIGKDTNDKIIYIEFKNIDMEKLKDARYLSISSREEYFEECDPNYDTEMFVGYGIEFNSSYHCGYMPTQKRLEEVDGDDWY